MGTTLGADAEDPPTSCSPTFRESTRVLWRLGYPACSGVDAPAAVPLALCLVAAIDRSMVRFHCWSFVSLDTDFEVRLQDVPLNNRRPDVTVYRADTIDVIRPDHVLLVVEVVSPGSETTDRIVKADQYAKAGIAFYWRIEQSATGVPLAYIHVLDPATGRYHDGEPFAGIVKASAPFAIDIDLGQI